MQHNIWVGLPWENFGQVFPAFGQLKFGATSPNGRVGKRVSVKHWICEYPYSIKKQYKVLRNSFLECSMSYAFKLFDEIFKVKKENNLLKNDPIKLPKRNINLCESPFGNKQEYKALKKKRRNSH